MFPKNVSKTFRVDGCGSGIGQGSVPEMHTAFLPLRDVRRFRALMSKSK